MELKQKLIILDINVLGVVVKKIIVSCCFLFTVFSLLSGSALASGFALYENSPRGAAVAGAFSATADDVSAVWYNPAGITQLGGTHVMGGATTYGSNGVKFKFDNGISDRSESYAIPTPYFYASHKLNDKVWLGMGLFSPFGLEAEYSKTWEGRYNTYYSGNIATEFNTNLVYKVSDSLSIGLGISLQQFEVEFKQKINAGAVYLQGGGSITDPLYTSLSEIDMDQKLFANEESGFRYNLSLLYNVNDKLSFGANYRSEVDYTLEGDATYKDVPAIFSSQLHNSNVSGDITLPMVIWTGIAYKVTPKLTLETDLVMTGWSSYNKLEFDIENSLGTQTIDKDWEDVYSIRIGADYNATDILALRVGYLYDESPIPSDTIDYAMPSTDRHMLTTGLGYKIGQWTVDCHYGFITLIGERDIDTRAAEGIIVDSTIKSVYVHQLGFSLAYMF